MFKELEIEDIDILMKQKEAKELKKNQKNKQKGNENRSLRYDEYEDLKKEHERYKEFFRSETKRYMAIIHELEEEVRIIKKQKETIKEVEKIVEVPKYIFEDIVQYRNKYTKNIIIVLILLFLVILAFLRVKIYYGSEYKLNANFEYNMRQYEQDLNDWLEVNEELTLDFSKKEDKYLDYKEQCDTSNFCLDTTLENYKNKSDKAQEKYDVHQENKPVKPKR